LLFAADFSPVLLNQRDLKLSDWSAELSCLPVMTFERRAPGLSWCWGRGGQEGLADFCLPMAEAFTSSGVSLRKPPVDSLVF
jgi:hypothetical protein